MATDIHALIRNLTDYYDFRGKRIIHVGAGGGQLVPYARSVGSVLAVDSDAEALDDLKEVIADEGLQDVFDIVHADFATLTEQGDVVLFEFCLHEMNEPAKMVAHGLELAPEVLVIDHERESDWAWHACETEKVDCSWSAVEQFKIERSQSYQTTQEFETHSQLLDKIACLGELAIERAKRFVGETGITIPMTYRIALVTGPAMRNLP
jgi:predicted RNA methylase